MPLKRPSFSSARTPRIRAVVYAVCAACFLLLCAAPGPVHAAPAGEPSASSPASTPQAVTRDFFAYLLRPKTDILHDKDAQQRWLSETLRKSLNSAAQAVAKARKLPGVDGPDPAMPDNGTFLDSWDLLTQCAVREGKTQELPMPGVKKQGVFTRVSVFCRWGEKTNYPGLTRAGTVILVPQAGSWRIKDIVWETNEYADAESVARSLLMLKNQSEQLAEEMKPPAKKR